MRVLAPFGGACFVSDVDECAELVDICGMNERCTNTVGSYACHCHLGYEYSKVADQCVGAFFSCAGA